MNFYEIHANRIKSYHIISKIKNKYVRSGLCLIGLISDLTTDHCAAVRLGYRPIGLLSCWVTVSQTTVPRANILSGCCTSDYCPVGLLSVQVVSLGKCPLFIFIYFILFKVGAILVITNKNKPTNPKYLYTYIE